jgi:hypothetical protein
LVREVQQMKPEPLPDDEPDRDPFWSRGVVIRTALSAAVAVTTVIACRPQNVFEGVVILAFVLVMIAGVILVGAPQ